VPLPEADVTAWLIAHIAEYRAIPPEAVRPDAEFSALGLDSVDAVVIGGALEERFDVEIDPALLLRCATIKELLAELRREGVVG
jgi:acyl carrier protein